MDRPAFLSVIEIVTCSDNSQNSRHLGILGIVAQNKHLCQVVNQQVCICDTYLLLNLHAFGKWNTSWQLGLTNCVTFRFAVS